MILFTINDITQPTLHSMKHHVSPTKPALTNMDICYFKIHPNASLDSDQQHSEVSPFEFHPAPATQTGIQKCTVNLSISAFPT